jgi:hypothetical protein
MPDLIEDISYSKNGCNYCENLDGSKNKTISKVSNFKDAITCIKEDGKKQVYDCIIGVSGGIDSSYVLHLALEAGLRPLAVHMDNGWNSALAQINIARLVKKANVDLYTHVIEWSVYRDMLNAFLQSDVVDIELLYDNAMLSVNYRLAKRFGIKWILGGMNTSTEGVRMPRKWSWFKFDTLNIKDILRQNGCQEWDTFPFISPIDFLYYKNMKHIRWVSLLDTIKYDKEEALVLLEEKYGYKRYPYKHYESILTRFYQAEILTKKFNIDKRQVHLSSLIKSNQITREESLQILEKSPYESEIERFKDRRYFMKKMNWTKNDLDSYLSRPPVPHTKYKTYSSYTSKIRYIKKIFGK